jgi:hypothetical protein
MTDHDKIYVYVGSESGYTNGHWYYWNGSAWADGGVYNSTAFETDKTLTLPDRAADAEATGDAIDDVKSDLDYTTSTHSLLFTHNMYIDTSNNTVDISTPLISATGLSYVVDSCSEGDIYTITGEGGSSGRLWCFIDSSGNSLSKSDAGASLTYGEIVAPPNSNKVVINGFSGITAVKGRVIKNIIEDVESEQEQSKRLLNTLFKVANLIDINSLLENKYYDITNGKIYTGDGSTKATPLIEASAGTYYLYTNTSGSQVFSGVCIYDASKQFVRAISEYNFGVTPKITIASNEKYIALTVANGKADKTALVDARYFGYFKSVGNSNNIIPPHLMKDYDDANNVIVVDAKGNGDYTTINEAVKSINDDGASNPYTILIYPSVYKEVVSIYGGRHISIIGLNMKDCIIRDDTGLYENTPLQVQGDCLIENLTIIATHDDNPSMPHTGNKAYAIHIDYEGAGITTVRNCRLISYQSSAIGAGLHQDQTLFIDNCELASFTPNASSWDESSDWTTTPSYGALFVHSATDSNITEQVLTVKNCMVTSANKRACAFSNSPDGTSNMEINLINNNFWCADGNADSTITEWYNPVYSGRSFGNNVNKLNA